MTILQAILLGIIEGVTEFLPISSTGHLILAGKLMGLADSNFLKSFEIAIQFGAILAVVAVYWKKIWESKETGAPIVIGTRPSTQRLSAPVWKKVFTAFLPTAIIGFLLYKILKTYLLSNAMLVVWALFLGGVILIAFEIWYKRKGIEGQQELSYKKSFLVGVFQSLAIIPGVSRSGATIIGGLLMGINRQAIVEFSFLLAVPTMAAATGYDLLKSAESFTFSEFHILAIGFIVSFIVAWFSIKWLLHFVKNHTFIWFGVYRIIVAILFYFLVIKF